RLGLPRDAVDLAERAASVCAALPGLPDELLVNDLEPAARSLCPEIADALADVVELGADVALLAGSGPTVLGLFADAARAEEAAAAARGREPAPVACRVVG